MSEVPSRRQFLSGQALRDELAWAGKELADRLAESREREPPQGGDTVRLGKTAMACDVEVIMNPGPAAQVVAASAALDRVDELEAQFSAYRPHSELTLLNQRAATEAVAVEDELFELLWRAAEISRATEGAFDPTAGPFVALWRACRDAGRLPTEEELQHTRQRVGCEHLVFDHQLRTLSYLVDGLQFNLGAIGKGHILDRAGQVMTDALITDWMIHAGFSSILARGGHNSASGWPVGIRNPLFPERNFATMLLRDRGMSTSGSGVQFFRHEGQRYGHILDPRTGWPVDGMLSVTVVAPTAEEADALSTAFFVLGVEKAFLYCHNQPLIGALLIPAPTRGARLEPVVCNIPEDDLFFAPN